MKSYGNLWSEITSAENFALAWRRVRRRHASSEEVLAYERNLEVNLEALRQELIAGEYRPGGFRQFKVWDPKPRIISCAPVRDRIVHHALCAVITPLLERRFIDGSYACRKGKGSHLACLKARELARRHDYFLKLDVRHYFDSIPHDRLLDILLSMFRESEVKKLIERIVREPLPNLPQGVGLPIGNLTSQWFANAYLDTLDHRIVRDWHVGGRYLRYMDDLLILADTKEECWRLAVEIEEWLKCERALELKSEATIVAPVSEGVPFLGLRIFAGAWRLNRGRFMRTRHTVSVKEAQWKAGIISEERFSASVAAADGAARWFGFKGILNNLGKPENKVTEEGASSGSNRVNRGGSWNNNANNCRSAYRNNNYNPSNYNNNLGFRLSSTLPPRPGSAGSHSARPALREGEDEHARPAAAGSVARRERCGRGLFWWRVVSARRAS